LYLDKGVIIWFVLVPIKLHLFTFVCAVSICTYLFIYFWSWYSVRKYFILVWNVPENFDSFCKLFS